MDFLRRDRSNRVCVYHAAAQDMTGEANEPDQKEGGTNEASIALMISVVITCNRYNLARLANVYEESA